MSVVREPNEPGADRARPIVGGDAADEAVAERDEVGAEQDETLAERRGAELIVAAPTAAERAAAERTVLEVADLYVEFDTYGGVVKAVRGASFDVKAGKTLAIVGESGCGKSVTVQSIMGLIPMPPGRITRGTALLDGVDILRQKIVGGEDVRGNRVGMIFQDPMSSLNPTMTVGAQIAETLEVHRGYSRAKAHARAVELLALTQIPEPENRARQYPFAFSGGMLQRAMIAMAIACEPDVLIADEPTTALDVTIQSQILDLLKELQRKNGMAIVLITHDLGVVARMADEVAVMYAGEIVERGAVDDVFYRPAHPYALGLKAAMPSNSTTKEQGLAPIEGSPPDLFHPPAGCAYFARCPYAMRLCEPNHPPRFDVGEGHYSRCWLHHPKALRRVAGLHVPASLGETACDTVAGSAAGVARASTSENTSTAAEARRIPRETADE